MTEYLQRLVDRGATGAERSLLQPIVRTASPIAERDQRIAMPEFEGFEFGATRKPGDSGRQHTEHRGRAALTAPDRPTELHGTTATRDHAPTTPATPGPQNVIVDAATSNWDHAASSVAQRVPGTEQLRPTGGAVRSDESADTGTHRENVETRPFKALRDELQVSPTPETDVGELGQTTRERGASVDLEGNVASDQSALPTVPRLPAESGPSGRDMVRASCGSDVGVAAGVATPSELSSTDTERPRGAAGADAHAASGPPPPPRESGPRVAIGRIDVEVICPPAESEGPPACRTEPLTAASASVIGPLGDGSFSNVRLNLKYR